MGRRSVLGWIGAVGITLASANPTRADDTEATFRGVVRPFLETYCLSCHGAGGKAPQGDLDLTAFRTVESVAADLPRWELVVEQLHAGTMPPAKAKARPDAKASKAIVAWVADVRKFEAKRHAGDPGAVPARRLSNAEYDNTIRDLTGVDLKPTKSFPVDPANEAGFDNSAESLAMSPALAKKYLDAARGVAEHLVLTPEGLKFAPHPMLADTDRDKYSVNRIINFYKNQRLDYADFFAAAWTYKHRRTLGNPDATLDRIADDARLSRKYLKTIWSVLTEPGGESGPIAALQTLWNDLPAPRGPGESPPMSGCKAMRELVVIVREQLVPRVPNLSSPGGINAGTQPFVLWKNREFVKNRMRYAGGAETVVLYGYPGDSLVAMALETPKDAEAKKRHEATFERFCQVFPDAFYVSERARVYLDPKADRNNTGRLLSAGFHSMTGYFRDDEPLAKLVLDEKGQAELEGLWRDFQYVTNAPFRQYSSYLWFERGESNFLRSQEFDFLRAEDKSAASDENIKRLAVAYLAKAKRVGAGPKALKAISDQFGIISAELRRLESDQVQAEPNHVAALQAFADRAYRRPLTSEERSEIADFYRRLRKDEGLSHEDAVRDTLASILLSPNFCYRVDAASAKSANGSTYQPRSDHDLASRLSYVLWSSMPDDELRSRADAGELHRPEVLLEQARRMLRDPKVRGLATEFAGNWLDFRRFEEHNSVDRRRFPSFDDALRSAMFEEPLRFFLDVVQNDRSVYEFIDGRHTFVNPPLAKHYGMPPPKGGPDDWTRVDDAATYGRGGLIPMSVFLTKNSPGLRTSPVKRGYWVVRRLLGEVIPAPPANVPDLPEDEAKLGERTLRETLARHRADKACSGCHERFDAIGLAFEGFGPIGERREMDLGGRPVDTRANFPGGMEGAGMDGLRNYIDARRKGEFAENLCRKLLAYSLGRTLIPSDDEVVEAMLGRIKADGGKFGGLVEVIVGSSQFRNRR